MKPIIGITPSPTLDKLGHGKFRRYAMSANYVEAVESAGGIPLVLPPQENNVSQILTVVEGILFSGGGDIDPARYGDTSTHPETYGVHDLRDRFEFDLVRLALEREVPVFCICRGIQVANVALGGTLIQDIADQHGTEIEHRQHVAGYGPSQPSHDVSVQPGTTLHDVFGQTTIRTNSFHHQAIRDLSPELRAVGWAPDGIIEAVDRPGGGWFLGVQWHPEMMFKKHTEHARPFQALVMAAYERREKAAGRVAVPGD
jgi:putative glutamine amidotransferase